MRRAALLALLLAACSDGTAPEGGRYALTLVDGRSIPQPYPMLGSARDSLLGGSIDFGARTIAFVTHRYVAGSSTPTVYASPVPITITGDTLCWAGTECRGFTRSGDKVTMMHLGTATTARVAWVYTRD